MKTNLLLLAAVTAIATFAGVAKADDAYLSPKARQLKEDFRKVPGTTTDKLDRSVKSGSPKGIEFSASLRTVPSTGPSIDLAHGPRPLLSPKDPRYDQALRELRQTQFQVAPLK